MDFYASIFERFAELLTKVLPLSPFRDFLSEFGSIPFLGYLNWFVPVSGILKVMVAWLAAISAFHLYGIIMRWVKVIGD